MQHLDKHNVQMIMKEIENAAQEIATKHNLHIESPRGSFSSNSATIKMTFSVISSGGIVETKERADFKSLAYMYRMKPEWIDEEFISPMTKKTYKIIGLRPRNHKLPVICQNLRDGKSYKFPINAIINAMGNRVCKSKEIATCEHCGETLKTYMTENHDNPDDSNLYEQFGCPKCETIEA